MKILPPRNTPDSFCRRFTRQNFSLDLQGGIFLFWELVRAKSLHLAVQDRSVA